MHLYVSVLCVGLCMLVTCSAMMKEIPREQALRKRYDPSEEEILPVSNQKNELETPDNPVLGGDVHKSTSDPVAELKINGKVHRSSARKDTPRGVFGDMHLRLEQPTNAWSREYPMDRVDPMEAIAPVGDPVNTAPLRGSDVKDQLAGSSCMMQCMVDNYSLRIKAVEGDAPPMTSKMQKAVFVVAQQKCIDQCAPIGSPLRGLAPSLLYTDALSASKFNSGLTEPLMYMQGEDPRASVFGGKALESSRL